MSAAAARKLAQSQLIDIARNQGYVKVGDQGLVRLECMELVRRGIFKQDSYYVFRLAR